MERKLNTYMYKKSNLNSLTNCRIRLAARLIIYPGNFGSDEKRNSLNIHVKINLILRREIGWTLK